MLLWTIDISDIHFNTTQLQKDFFLLVEWGTSWEISLLLQHGIFTWGRFSFEMRIYINCLAVQRRWEINRSSSSQHRASEGWAQRAVEGFWGTYGSFFEDTQNEQSFWKHRHGWDIYICGKVRLRRQLNHFFKGTESSGFVVLKHICSSILKVLFRIRRFSTFGNSISK